MSMKKSLLFVLGMIILVISAQFSVGECRALRSMGACEQVDGAESAGMASFVVSSKNSSTNHSSARRLAFRLASGPSKKGSGH